MSNVSPQSAFQNNYKYANFAFVYIDFDLTCQIYHYEVKNQIQEEEAEALN